jgi:hypothetical protein
MAFPNLLGLMWFMGWIHISYIVAYCILALRTCGMIFLWSYVCCSLDFENHSDYLSKVPPCFLHAMFIYVKFMSLKANLQSVMHNYDSCLHILNAFLIPMHSFPKLKTYITFVKAQNNDITTKIMNVPTNAIHIQVYPFCYHQTWNMHDVNGDFHHQSLKPTC